MKISNKFLGAIAIGLMIYCVSCCRSQNPENKLILPEPIRISESTTRFHSIGYLDQNISGMHYRILITSFGDVSTINITKDSLEVINLQKK